MARGFESKSVEEQQDEAARSGKVEKSGKAVDAEKKRRIQELSLQRERILSERTASPHRRSALEAALLEIEERLSELGWTIHM